MGTRQCLSPVLLLKTLKLCIVYSRRDRLGACSLQTAREVRIHPAVCDKFYISSFPDETLKRQRLGNKILVRTIDKPCLSLPSHYIQLSMHAAFSLYTARDANFCFHYLQPEGQFHYIQQRDRLPFHYIQQRDRLSFDYILQRDRLSFHYIQQ